MPLPFNKALDVKLLKLVKENPILYDVKHMKYMDFDTREVVWQKIGDELNRPACEFAGLQCQIQYGDYQEEKHKTGYLEDYKELLPANISNRSGLEKKILKEYKKHQGLSSLDAKHLYTKTARELPTYGVTFFVVKEKQQKGKKKLVPRLLGISANAILRLDEETKEILQAWPLTQVMSYQVGKSHTFTLNFGDYSDKEYSVKTNDAVRIRDILQGYIDIIAKRMAGGRGGTMSDGQAIVEDSVHAARANFIQHVDNNPSKVVEESFVGPTKIISYEPGQTVSQGTHLVTVQQVLISNKMANQQYTITGEVPHRKGMSLEFVRKLNRMNSNSVKIVNLISSDDGPHTAELISIVETMENDMPLIASGVNEVLTSDMDEETKKRLQNELQELMDYLKTLAQHVHGSDPGSYEALEAASKIADVSTQMYLGLDPLTKRRSNLIRMSRQSFIEDEKTDASLRRASFIAASAGACAAVDDARALINQDYKGAALSPSEVEELERSARDKMRKLNGAVALFLTAHADLEHIDYSAAVTSMNTINELILELAKDSQALASTREAACKQQLVSDVNKLCAATRLVCSLGGCTDHQKLQDVISDYSPVADKLIFTFGRGRRDDNDNKIIDLAKDVGEKTSSLLMKANELIDLLPSPQAEQLDAAGQHCAGAASELLACAMLTSPCIHEPHCQSALTASSATLSSSAQQLLLAARPALEHPGSQAHGDELRARSLDLARALDALRHAYDNENQTNTDTSAAKDPQRLKFIMRLADANKDLDEAEKELNKPLAASKPGQSPVVVAILEKTLAIKMAEYNAAVAKLLVATADRESPDYAVAEAAIVKMNETMIGIVKDTKTLAATKDEGSRKAMLEDVKKLCEATRAICASAGSSDIADLNESAASLADTSNKLYFTFNPAAPDSREQEILDIATAACTAASAMLSDVYQLSEQTAGHDGALLDARGARAAHGAKALLTVAQLTAACTGDPSCQSSLVQAAASLSTSSSELVSTCSKMQSPLADKICDQQRELERELDKLRMACSGGHKLAGRSEEEEKQRLQFVRSAAAAKRGLLAIEEELNKPFCGDSKDRLVLTRQQQLSDAMARLNSAIAALTTATADPDNPDYAAADEAMATITELMPLVVMDTKAMASSKDEKTREAMMADLRAICEAAREICDANQDPHQLRESAKKFGSASGKLVYVLNPRTKPDDANKVIKHANQVCNAARQLVKDVHRLSDSLYSTDAAARLLRRAAGHSLDAADALLTATQLTAPSLGDPRCRSALLSSAQALASSAHQLAQQWAPIHALDKQEMVKKLDAQHAELLRRLQDMRKEIQGDYIDSPVNATDSKPETNEQKRVRFADTVSTTKSGLRGIEEELTKPYSGSRPEGQALTFRQLQLSNSLARLNAALAALAVATTDVDNPDYVAADEAMNVIRETLPQVVKDTKAMASVRDDTSREAMLGHVRAMCAATSDICDQADRDPKALRNFAKKFATSSGKLIYVVNSRAKPTTASQVMESTQAACKTANQLVKTSGRLSDQLGPSDVVRHRLADSGRRTAHAADALMTAAQLTAPCLPDPACQSSLSSSIASLSSSAQQLSSHWSPLLHEPLLTAVIRELERESRQLTAELTHLRGFCQESKTGGSDAKADEQKIKETQKNQYISKAAAANEALMAAEKELDKPVVGSPAAGEAASAQQQQLTRQLARLHAALLALCVATADNNNSDYVTAEKSIDTIREVTPHVLRNSNMLLAGKDKAVEASELRALAAGLKDICGSAQRQDSDKLHDLLMKNVIPRLGKLYYVVHPKAGTVKLGKMESHAKSSASAASQLLSRVSPLAQAAGPAGAQLDQKGAAAADAAKALLTAVQLTGPYIHETESQSALISVADALSSSAHDLAAVWSPIIQEPKHHAAGEMLTRDLQELEEELDKFRKACREMEPEIVHKSVKKPLPPPKKPSDEEAKRKQFTAAAEEVAGGLRAAEEDIQKVYNSSLDAPKMHKDQVKGVQKALEKKIALSNVATSALLACNATEPMDYTAAAKSTSDLASLLPRIAQDAKVLSNTMPEKQRKAFLDDILAMFDATRKVIDAAQNNRNNLNGLAVEYGNKSGALLYSVCTDFDPSHEKEVISRAKSIGESVSDITESSAALMSDASPEKTNELCTKGKACATAAGNLVYTAKLVAPSIQVQECREILIEASKALSSRIKAFSSAWQPLSADPQHKATIEELNVKTAKAEGLLEELKKDLQSDKLVRLRPSELMVEDTPLRELAAALIEGAMKKSTNSSLPAEQKRAYVEYARLLTAASDQLDRANALCKQEPHNLEKRRELEEAVQNLQVTALQSRPSVGDHKQQYIVDLTEYVKELSQEADNMVKTTATCSTKPKEIDTDCHQIAKEAERILHPSNHHNRGDATTADDIEEVDRFGRTTEGRVKKIASQIQVLPDSKDKTQLNTQSVNLEDSCNILRFATQSAIATSQSASLDETLQDLTDLEGRLDHMLEAGGKHGHVNEPIPWSVRSSLLQATRGISSQPLLCSSLMQYVEEQRTRTDLTDLEAKRRLREHLRKLTYLLRVLTVETGRRLATWQSLDGPEVAAVMEQVIKEIDSGCSLHQPKKDQRSVLQNIDLNRLLLSSDVIKMEGDRKHVEDKLQQSASKLSSTLSTVVSSSGQPDSLARSLNVTADSACELAAVARALKRPDDPVYNAKIEEAVRDVTFQTYNVLTASDLVSQEPNNPAYRRRLLDACRALTDALNNLGRTTSPGNKLSRECSELTRNLQWHQTLLQSAQPTCALPYAECVDALQSQQEVIQKLSSDQPLSKEEFSRALSYVTSAVCNSTELAAHCGYLMSLCERDQEAAKVGVVDIPLLQKVTDNATSTCYRVLQFDTEQAKEEAAHLITQTRAVREALLDAEQKSQHLGEEIRSEAERLGRTAGELADTLQGPADKTKISAATSGVLDSLRSVSALTAHPSLLPAAGDLTDEARQRRELVLTAARNLSNKTSSLVRDVKAHDDRHADDGPMTWVTFNLKRKDVVKAFDDLLASVRENGQKAGILEVEHKEEEVPKSYVQTQVELANKWLKRPNCKPEVKAAGEEAVGKVIDIAEKVAGDMKDHEKEDMCALIAETKDLLSECSKKCSPDKASQLVERLKALKKAIERGVITMVVEDFIEGEEPLQDLEILVDGEADESRRKLILERKLAELLSQLSRVTRTAGVVARAGPGARHAKLELNTCTEQANLLAPLLVKAAQERIDSPDNKAAIENYKSLLAQYAESLSKVRELCDKSVDPMEFVQTAGETMQRMREESSHANDPQECVYTSSAITKLANRVIQVSMSSSNAKQDPELRKALTEAQRKLLAAVPGPQTRRSNMPDWKDTTAEILRTTGQVEAVMGGEMIFQNQPQSDQPIFAAARELHTAVREWSARDNEIVAVAKRTAVLMAKLSAYMNNNKKHELIVTSKSIVANSQEVAELARKLAHECDDVRIRTNLLQVCDQIPTISGQLKMLTTVKGSSLGHQGNKEDQESLNMLVDNAQNLMSSIQQVVKVSAGASVKIQAQRGGLRVRWVRRRYY